MKKLLTLLMAVFLAAPAHANFRGDENVQITVKRDLVQASPRCDMEFPEGTSIELDWDALDQNKLKVASFELDATQLGL